MSVPTPAPVGPGLGAPAGGVGISTDGTGIQVATGEPSALLESSNRLTYLGQTLEAHSSVLVETAGSLVPSWSGQAASAYQRLSSIVGAHFRAAAGISREAAASLHSYSAELDRCQREGMVAVSHAEACLTEIQTETPVYRLRRLHEAPRRGR